MRVNMSNIISNGDRPEQVKTTFLCENPEHNGDELEGAFKYILCGEVVHKFPEWDGRKISDPELALEKMSTDTTYCCDDFCFSKVLTKGYLVGKVSKQLCR